MKPGERQLRVCFNVSAGGMWTGHWLAFQRSLSRTNVSSLLAKVACLMVYRGRQVRHD